MREDKSRQLRPCDWSREVMLCIEGPPSAPHRLCASMAAVPGASGPFLTPITNCSMTCLDLSSTCGMGGTVLEGSFPGQRGMSDGRRLEKSSAVPKEDEPQNRTQRTPKGGLVFSQSHRDPKLFILLQQEIAVQWARRPRATAPCGHVPGKAHCLQAHTCPQQRKHGDSLSYGTSAYMP